MTQSCRFKSCPPFCYNLHIFLLIFKQMQIIYTLFLIAIHLVILYTAVETISLVNALFFYLMLAFIWIIILIQNSIEFPTISFFIIMLGGIIILFLFVIISMPTLWNYKSQFNKSVKTPYSLTTPGNLVRPLVFMQLVNLLCAQWIMVHQIDMFVLQTYIPYSKFEFFAFDL